MHHANHFYGHADIMARYCGLTEVERIWGYLQHGWNLHDGFAVGTAFAPGYPKFVWSDTVLRRAWAAGLRDLVVVGSPFAYLLTLGVPTDLPPVIEAPESLSGLSARATDTDGRTATTERPRRAGTIVFPFHGWEGQHVAGGHGAYAAQVRVVEGDVALTACLYWHEFRDPAIRAAYAQQGFRVITNGARGHMYRGNDARYLDKQLHELRAHSRVVSNRLGTALLYGAATGASIGVYGDPMVLANDHAVLGGMAKQLRLHPELHQPFVPDEWALGWATTELGLGRTLPPAEVRHLFAWEHGVTS